MTTLDKDAVAAARKAFEMAGEDDLEQAITAYIDALSSIPEQGGGVKPLEWTKVDNANDDESEEAVTPFGGYVITADPFTYSPTTAYYVDGPDWFKAQCASVPEAKAAAQADYEARIRSALIPSHPAAVAVTDEMVETAARKLLLVWDTLPTGGKTILTWVRTDLLPAFVELRRALEAALRSTP